MIIAPAKFWQSYGVCGLARVAPLGQWTARYTRAGAWYFVVESKS